MLEKGQIAPHFSLLDMNGQRQSLREISKKGPVLVAFFKISCPTCQLTLPFLERLRPTVQVVGISQDDRAETQEFLDYFKIAFPVLLDTARDDYAVSNAYRLTNVPSMFAIEPDGKITWALHGFHRAELTSLAAGLNTILFLDSERVPILKPG